MIEFPSQPAPPLEIAVQSMLADASEMGNLLRLAESPGLSPTQRTRIVISALDIAQAVERWATNLPANPPNRRRVQRALIEARRALTEWHFEKST